MEKSVQITLIIVIAVLLVISIPGFLIYQKMNPGVQLTAQGVSQIKATPDIASVYLNVQTKGVDAVTAKNKNSETVDAILTALIKEGFERKDIQTLNYQISPDREWINGKMVDKGYIASYQIRVEMPTEQSSKIGDVIDAGVNNGATLNYINFELSQAKQNEYKALALKQATEDARIKAESIALGLGKQVGKVVSVSSSDFGYSPWRMFDAVAGASTAEMKTAATSIQPSDQDINANVNVVFALK
jgi:hypothetical protein